MFSENLTTGSESKMKLSCRLIKFQDVCKPQMFKNMFVKTCYTLQVESKMKTARSLNVKGLFSYPHDA